MLSFIIYEGKAALALLVFYLFYRFLLKKETFHRFNRIVLVGTAIISFLLPFFIITIHRPMKMPAANAGLMATNAETASTLDPVVGVAGSVSTPWWQLALTILFFAGAACVLGRVAVSIASIMRIIRQGEIVREENGCKIVVTDRDIDPFSWMRYIVLSREDWKGSNGPIVAHEKAHIAYGHSEELLLVDFFSALQWFNPAIWMLRADLQELHEYEADDAVLRGGANIRDYQYLLIRKAVGKSGYSVANSFNHSILKNRITMMSKTKSPLRRGLRALYLLPLVCLGIGLQAQTVHDQPVKVNEKDGNAKIYGTVKLNCPDDARPLIILRNASGEEREITKEELENMHEILMSVEIVKDSLEIRKYGDSAKNGLVIAFSNKVDIQFKEEGTGAFRFEKSESGKRPYKSVDVETLPTFQGERMNSFAFWLNQRFIVPDGYESTKKSVDLGFVITDDGSLLESHIVSSDAGEEINSRLLSLVNQSPKWGPATIGGQSVASYVIYHIDLYFQ